MTKKTKAQLEEQILNLQAQLAIVDETHDPAPAELLTRLREAQERGKQAEADGLAAARDVGAIMAELRGWCS